MRGQNNDFDTNFKIKEGGERALIPSQVEKNLVDCSTTTGGLRVCRIAAKNWVYPAHIPERKYQLYAMSKSLLSNTLVCYPTGLGKTLIAAVVMHNFLRWFPEVSFCFFPRSSTMIF